MALTLTKPKRNRYPRQSDEQFGENNSGHWPRNILEACHRSSGPYTIENAATLLQEESLEIYNGWLVWQGMTDAEERRIAATILVILDLAARLAGFGRAYPDQMECKLSNGNVIKPDVCLISEKLYDEKVLPTGPEGRMILHSGPELAVELRSPSNKREEEEKKRGQYFDNGTQIVWDIEPKKRKLWVYYRDAPTSPVLLTGKDIVTLEPFLPGWQRPVADLFSKTLTAEQMLGQAATDWREESRAEGQAEGELQAVRKMLLLQARLRFGSALPTDLEIRLSQYSSEELTNLVITIATAASLSDWLATFPG